MSLLSLVRNHARKTCNVKCDVLSSRQGSLSLVIVNISLKGIMRYSTSSLTSMVLEHRIIMGFKTNFKNVMLNLPIVSHLQLKSVFTSDWQAHMCDRL